MDRVKKLKRNITLFYLDSFLGSLIFILPIWVTFQRQYLTFTQMSLLTGVRFFCAILFELPTGAFADLFGRKLSVVLGFLIQAASLLIMGLSVNGIQLAFGLIIMGIGEAFASGADIALLYDSLKELKLESEFQKIRSKSIIIVQAGIIISSIFAGYLFNFYKPLPYFAEAVSLFLSALIFFQMYEEKRPHSSLTINKYIDQTMNGVKEVFKKGFTRDLSIFYVLIGGLTWSWQVYFNQIYATSIGYSEVGKGWLFAIIRFINSVLIIRILHFDRYITKKNVFIIYPLLLLISTLPTIYPSFALGTLLLFLMTLASTLRFVVLDGYVNEEFTSHHRATAISALNMLVRLVYILSVALSGPLLDKLPAGATYFIMGIIVLIVVMPKGISLSRQATSPAIARE